MNIAIDIRPLMNGMRTGVGEYTFELLNALFTIDRDNQYFLFYNSYSNISRNIPKWQCANVHYVYTRFPNKLFNIAILSGVIKLDRLITRYTGAKIDVFFAPNLNFINLSKSTKFVLTIHDLSYEFFPEFYTTKTKLWHKMIRPKKLCRRANILITPSHNTKRDIVNYYKIEPVKITNIYPGLATTLGTPTPEIITKVKNKYLLPEQFILFLGTIEPRKNIIGLIEAFEQAYPKISKEYHLVIAGASGWKNSKIYDRANISPVRNKIHILGYIAPEDKAALYTAATAFVYPSFYEGFGFPVLEAMSIGKPVITSNRSSLPEIGGPATALINPNRPNDIAQALVRVLNNIKLQQYYAENGKIIAKNFSWVKTADEFLHLINL